MSRTKVIAGNWKMNKTPAEAAEFIMELKESVKGIKNEIIAAVPFVCIPAALTASEGSNIKIAAQNMHWEDNGRLYRRGFRRNAEGSRRRIRDHRSLGAARIFRRNQTKPVNRKAHAAFKYGLKPIICVGESLRKETRALRRSTSVTR